MGGVVEWIGDMVEYMRGVVCGGMGEEESGLRKSLMIENIQGSLISTAYPKILQILAGKSSSDIK